MRKKGDLKLIQELNRSIILETIRVSGRISRADIAKKNGLSPTTVSSAVNELIQEGLVSEFGTGSSNGGRKPVLLQFDPDNKFLIGVSVTNSLITVAELNLEASVHKKTEYQVQNQIGDSFVTYVLECLEQFLQGSSDFTKCVGISVIVPGVIDSVNGVIHYNARLGLKEVPLKAMIEKRFGLPTWLDNDVNAIALAEKNFGAFQEFDNLIYIRVDQGIGVGIYMNGSIYRGHFGGAGEFGHISIDHSGIRCECGNVGCLENYVSWSAIYSKIIVAITKGRPTMMMDFVNGDVNKITPRDFRRAIDQHDSLAIAIIDEIANYLGVGIVNLVNLFNPQGIIIGGELAHNNSILLSKVKDIINQQALKTLTKGLEIHSASLGENFEVIGAAAVLLREMFHFSLST
jgi:N-acetylglucosamine repressor